MNKITVAVTGLNAIDSPGPGVGVIRSLRDCPDLDVRIVGLAYENLEPGIYMDFLIDKTYEIPYPTAGIEALAARLDYIHQREKLDVIIPNFDAELPNFIHLSGELKEKGIHTFLPSLSELEALDKLHLHHFGKEHGMRVPRTIEVPEAGRIPELEDDLDYPMVVKGRFYEAIIARNREEVYSAFTRLSAKWGLPVIVQEFVEGTEIDIAGLGDGNGRLIGAVPMRKLYITDKGKAWSGVTLKDDRLLDYTHRFIKASQWRGGFELEIMRKAKEDTLYLMEINPRFPAWIYTTAAVGQNLPAALVKLATGHKVAPFRDYQVGKMFIRYAWELITDIENYRQIATTGEYPAVEAEHPV